LVAHPDHMDAIRAGKFEKKYNEFNDTAVVEAYELLQAQKGKEIIADAAKTDAYLALGQIKGVNWDFVIQYPKSLLSKPAQNLALFILGVGIVSLLGELLTMFFVMRKNIAQPLTGFMDATRALASGNFNVELDTKRNDELGELGGLFKNMAENIKDHQENLEHKIEVRTQEIAEREKSLKLILDNTGDGFLTTDIKGTLQGQTSQSVKDWFGQSSANACLWDYLFNDNARFKDNFQCIFEELNDSPMFFDINIEQLPRKFSREQNGNTQYFQMEYRPIKNEQDEVQTILTVVRDVTAQVQAEAKEQERLEFVAVFERILKDKVGFTSFLQEINGILAQIPGCKVSADTITAKRLIHTVKGNTAVYGMNSISKLCHEIEDQFMSEPDLAWNRTPEIEARWKNRMDKVTKMLGDGTNNNIEVPTVELDAAIAQVQNSSPARVRELLESWKLEPVSRKLMRLADAVQQTAKKQGKSNVQARIENGSLRLPAMDYGDFFAQLVHVVRNAVDHGCESASAREAAGKPGTATVTLSAELNNNTLTVVISDDGKGVAWHKLKEKGASLGMKVDTHEDMINVMFADGVSTADKVSETSGRGVGASAAKESCLKLGGKIRVESEPGQGTRFCFDIPVAKSAQEPAPLRKAS
jgi:two-component system, chemotaxis family, sensor kinase CheA